MSKRKKQLTAEEIAAVVETEALAAEAQFPIPTFPKEAFEAAGLPSFDPAVLEPPVEEATLTVANEIELEQLLAAAEEDPEPLVLDPWFGGLLRPSADLPPTRRMSGDEVAALLRQRRRETRRAERGY